ncbi:hypothetical protein D3C78_1361030 [compost metagenome]
MGAHTTDCSFRTKPVSKKNTFAYLSVIQIYGRSIVADEVTTSTIDFTRNSRALQGYLSIGAKTFGHEQSTTHFKPVG